MLRTRTRTRALAPALAVCAIGLLPGTAQAQGGTTATYAECAATAAAMIAAWDVQGGLDRETACRMGFAYGVMEASECVGEKGGFILNGIRNVDPLGAAGASRDFVVCVLRFLP